MTERLSFAVDVTHCETPGLVVHRVFGAWDATQSWTFNKKYLNRWTVTHVSSGKNLAWFFANEENAVEFANRLGNSTVDWQLSEGQIRAAVVNVGWPRLKAAIDRLAGELGGER